MKVPESKVLPSTHVVADLLGIPRYFACTMPSNLRKKRAQNKERYIQNRQRRKEAARAASRASYKADPEKKRAASRASYKTDPEKKRAASCARYKACPGKKRAARRAKYRLNLPPPASPMRAKAFLMLTGVHTKPVLHAPSHQCSTTLHTLSCHLPKKNTPKQDIEKALYKKCKNHSCRDALPPKNNSPKTNETSDNAHWKACTDYPHITAQCIYCVPTIPTYPVQRNGVFILIGSGRREASV